MTLKFTACILSFVCLQACTPNESEKYAEEKARAPFLGSTTLGTVSDSLLDEISGIAASRRYPGYYWVHNDSGGDPSVYLIDSLAQRVAEVRLEGVTNRDWEDIAVAQDVNGISTIYVAEIGDNGAVYGNYSIYAFPEPEIANGTNVLTLHPNNFLTHTFEYPDGAKDAETLLVDPSNNDFIIISKRGDNVVVYQWPASERTIDNFVLHKAGSIPFWMIVGGDISADGQELLLKNYESVFYWKKDAEVTWIQALMTNPHRLPYQPEPQGEAIAFTSRGEGFVTLSEKTGINSSQHLFFYSRKPEK